MNTAPYRPARSLVAAAAAALLAACADRAPVGPDPRATSPAQRVLAARAGAQTGKEGRAPELGVCTNLRAPAGSTIAFHAYAIGVQIYRWNGTAWVFVAPSAQLYADAGGHGLIGTHYSGPTWESVSGSTVKGSVIDRCTPDATAIPWLSLAAVPIGGHGVFQRTTFIQRVNTVGGLAPSSPGTFVGELREVPYTAEYYFYRAP